MATITDRIGGHLAAISIATRRLRLGCVHSFQGPGAALRLAARHRRPQAKGHHLLLLLVATQILLFLALRQATTCESAGPNPRLCGRRYRHVGGRPVLGERWGRVRRARGRPGAALGGSRARGGGYYPETDRCGVTLHPDGVTPDINQG